MTDEAKLQLEYIEKLKKLIEGRSKSLGRKMTCHVTTFGCQMNTEHAY